MYRFLILLFLSTPALAELKQQNSFDLGIGFAPVMAPESGYKNVRVRFGFEAAISFFKFNNDLGPGLLRPKSSVTSFKLFRTGLAIVSDQPIVIFSPIAISLKEGTYLSPTFGFGKDPYALFSFSHEFFP